MQMKTWLRWILITLVLAAGFHLIALALFPRAIMALAVKRILKRSGAEINTLVHSPRVNVDTRNIVKPSPDLLYSICVYDVGEKPLRITAPLPGTYWSISFYQANTDNYYVLNDRQTKSNPVDIVLVASGQAAPNVETAEVVVAPAAKGVFLLRLLITDDGNVDDLVKIQRLATCKPL
jgi:uncharacterized membrane protein